MNDISKVTMTSLLKKAPLLLRERLEVLILLSLLYGLIAGAASFPLLEVLKPILSSEKIDVAAVLDAHGMQILTTKLFSMLVSSALLIPITRLLVDAEPFEGGLTKFLGRFSRIFALQIKAISIFMLFILLLGIVVGILSIIVPQALILILALTGVFAGMLAIFTVAHVAIVGEAIDSRTSIMVALTMIRPLLMPLAAAYGAILITSFMFATIFSLAFGGIAVDLGLAWLPSVFNHAIDFAANILHFAACLFATQAIMQQRKNNNGQS